MQASLILTWWHYLIWSTSFKWLALVACPRLDTHAGALLFLILLAQCDHSVSLRVMKGSFENISSWISGGNKGVDKNLEVNCWMLILEGVTSP